MDSSAHYILGVWLLEHPEKKEIIYHLAESEILWEQRIAILTTFAFIRAGRFDDTFAIAEKLLNHEHDLIHQAVGWMLRGTGSRCVRPGG